MYHLLQSGLEERAAAGRPIRVGLIGAGKFGVGLAVQIAGMEGIELSAAADLSLDRARHAYTAAGWKSHEVRVAENISEVSFSLHRRRPCITDDPANVIDCPEVEVLVEATGSPEAGAVHAAAAIEQGKHVVMVNVEADVTVGALLRMKADAAGVVYTLVDGDQPGATMNLVAWARALGFRVVAAGRGTIMRDDDRAGTPESVQERFGFTDEQMARRTINRRMYNSFRDGTKAQIEMTALANMAGLAPDVRGMHEPTVTLEEMPSRFALAEEGGILKSEGVVELANSVDADGQSIKPGTLRMGVFTVIQTDHPYTREDLLDYMGFSGAGGRNYLLYRPYHLVAVTAPLSILRAVLLEEATGQPLPVPTADVITVAKKDLAKGTELDGGGGYTVAGLCEKADVAATDNLLPLGLSKGCKLLCDVRAGESIRREMVDPGCDSQLAALRREQDRLAGGSGAAAG